MRTKRIREGNVEFYLPGDTRVWFRGDLTLFSVLHIVEGGGTVDERNTVERDTRTQCRQPEVCCWGKEISGQAILSSNSMGCLRRPILGQKRATVGAAPFFSRVFSGRIPWGASAV